MKNTAFAIFFLLCSFVPRGLAEPLVVNGVLDLRGQSLEHPIDLRGDWNFSWQNQGPEVPLKTPGNWFQDKRYDYTLFGYGRYRLTVEMDHIEQMAFYFPEIWSASRIVLDGEEKALFGQPTSLEDGYRAGTGRRIFVFTPKSTRFELIIETANYDLFLSGVTQMLSLGRASVMIHNRDSLLAADLVVIGALLIMSIYHLCLFALRTEDKSTFWFAIVCFFVMIYTATSGSAVMITLWPDIDFRWRLAAFNFSWMVATHAFIWFAHDLFQPYFRKRWAITGSTIATLHHIMVLTTAPKIFVNGSVGFQFLVVPILGYTCWVAWQHQQQSREGNRSFLFGIVVLVLAVVNDMLSLHQMIKTPVVGGFGVAAFILVQSYLLAHRFSSAFIKVKSSEREIRSLSQNLQEVNQNLELIVEDKTRDIRSIMQHIPIGIFIIGGSEGLIAREHSRQLTQIFDLEGLEGMDAASLLFTGSQLSEDEKSQAVSAIHMSLNELEMNFDVNSNFLPLQLHRRDAKGFLRIYDLTWDKIINVQGLTEKILVTIRDVTELKGLQDKAQGHQDDLEIIGEILNVTPLRFDRFIRSAQHLLAENARLIQSQKPDDRDLLKLLFINIHTIKGSARGLYLKKMTDVLHEVEQAYAEMKKETVGFWDGLRIEGDHTNITLMLERYDRIAREKLGRGKSGGIVAGFPVEELQRHYKDLQPLLHEMRHPVLQSIAQSFLMRIYTPVGNVMREICSALPALARDLHKDPPLVRIEDNGLLATQQIEDLLHQTFVHILRNSLDHGIESPEERAAANKDRTPTITMQFLWQEEFVSLLYWDDGRGLDLNKLRELAVKQQLLNSEQLQNRLALAELIFTANVSTAQTVTDISGRGVGMGAIRQYVEQNGGSVTLHLSPHDSRSHFASFRLDIKLPSHFFVASQVGEKELAAS